MKKKVISSDTESLEVLIANPIYDEVFSLKFGDLLQYLTIIQPLVGEIRTQKVR
jgi:hypothetical protein